MKRKVSVVALLVLAILLCAGLFRESMGGCHSERTSRPLEYSGYSSPEYSGYIKTSEYVSTDDGTKLAVDVYLPSDGPTEGPFPAVLFYTPYKRATVDLETGEITMFMAPDHEELMKTFASYGYAVVTADMRGSGASYGSRVEMSPQLAKDGKQLIDWLEDQGWCDGNVGMYGGSYMGWSQFAVAGQGPRALKCIMPEVMAFDMFDEFHYPGGILNRLLVSTWGPRQILFDLSLSIPTLGLFPAAPVVDEDKDGRVDDEVPLDLDADGFFYDDPPTYRDGVPRDEDIYYNSILEHLENIYPHQFVPGAPYLDSTLPGLGYTYLDLHPNDWPVHIAKSRIPIYTIGGWFDIFTRATTRWYATMKVTNQSKMLMHPSFHSLPGYTPPSMLGPYWEYFGEEIEQAGNGFRQEKIRFFDRYLKGIKNGIEQEPPIYIYVMNAGKWRFENEWPLTRQVATNYYFQEENALSTCRKSGGSDDYLADFTHSSTYGTNNMTRWRGTVDQVMKRTDKDLKCLTSTSEPLEENTEVTGHPIVHLWVSSTANYGDFFVYLEDVDESGEAYYVTEGLLRAGFAGIVSDDSILPPDAQIDLKPDLPYHGFKQADYVDGIFSGGNIVELVIDLLPTSWVFKEGHRIRVSIACADWPTFDLHPKLSPANDPEDSGNIVPLVTVYRDAEHPSRIELPVILSRPRVFEGNAWVKTSGAHYWGPAELYTYQNAVYLHFQDRWIKWDTVKYREKKRLETFKCDGDFGKLRAFVRHRRDDSYGATAVGCKVWFRNTRD